MPLAISHAGCFLRETKADIEEYLGFYDEAFSTMQSKKPALGWDYRNDTAATTWEISFDAVNAKNKDAGPLFLVCSFLSPEDIGHELFWDQKRSKLAGKQGGVTTNTCKYFQSTYADLTQ